MKTGLEVDLDEEYEIQKLKQVIFDNDTDCFYVLANQRENKYGFYLVKIPQDDPFSYSYILNWKTKLQIGDCSVYILKTPDS